MNVDEIELAFAAIAGYWPTPSLTEEETVAWTTELFGLPYGEVMATIRAESARRWRPRPGELVDLVKQYRRQEALRRPRPQLPSAEGQPCTPEANLAHVAEVRALFAARRCP